jgi:hypothetical protein
MAYEGGTIHQRLVVRLGITSDSLEPGAVGWGEYDETYDDPADSFALEGLYGRLEEREDLRIAYEIFHNCDDEGPIRYGMNRAAAGGYLDNTCRRKGFVDGLGMPDTAAYIDAQMLKQKRKAWAEADIVFAIIKRRIDKHDASEHAHSDHATSIGELDDPLTGDAVVGGSGLFGID